MSLTKPQITQLIQGFNGGDRAALERLMPMVYDQLRKIASNKLRSERAGHTLQPTALVNEVFLLLLNKNELPYESRAHFFAAAAKLMRWILLDRAKAKKRDKRGGGAVRVTFNEAIYPAATSDDGIDIEALDQALTRLAAVDERRAKVVELRFFGGLDIEETALVLGASVSTVKRDWVLAKAWLLRELSEEQAA